LWNKQKSCGVMLALAGEKGWHASEQWWFFAIPLQPGEK